MNTVPARVHATALEVPDNPAIRDSNRTLTYRELDTAIGETAHRLRRQHRVSEGDIVALYARNSAEFVVAYLAVSSLGAVAQPIDLRLTAQESTAQLSHAGTRLILTAESVQTLPRGWPAPVAAIELNDFEPPSVCSSLAGPIEDATAELIYTSGTTGTPRGVCRTHRGVLAAVRNAQAAFGYRPDDILLIGMPLSHSSALTSQLLPALCAGARVVLLERFDPAGAVEAMRRDRVTCVRAVPAMFHQLLLQPDFSSSTLPWVRLLINSSATITPALLSSLRERFPSVDLVNSYGLTEASTCTLLTGEDLVAHPDSIGRPVAGVEADVFHLDGDARVADGATGELRVRGPHLFSGYWRDPDGTSATLAGGWLRTGDLAHRDSSGLLYLDGRVDDAINCGGFTFSPEAVSACIRTLAEVDDAAVVGVPHSVLGDVGKAFVVLRGSASLSARDIVRHCTRNLPSHMVPFSVVFVDCLPRNSVGKVLLRELRRIHRKSP